MLYTENKIKVELGLSNNATKSYGTLSGLGYFENFTAEKDIKKYFSCVIYSKNQVKVQKDVTVLSTSRPLDGETINDSKEKPQVMKVYNFTKGGTDIVYQPNGYYTTQAKSCVWVMVALFCMVDKM